MLDAKKKRTRVERELDNLRDWNSEDRKELRNRLFNELYDDKEEARKQANLIPLEGSKEQLKEWAKNDGKLRGLTTGYWTLDRMTAGLCGGDLDVIAGVSSIGKTNIVVNMIARQITLGHKVAFVTLEMSKQSILQRLYSIIGEDNFDAVMNDDPILVQEQDRIPYQSIKYAVKQAKEWGAEAFYIDHLHYFSRTMENQTEGLGAITQEFKFVAKEYDIPIVLLSQLRKTNGERPTGEDLRGSALIKQDADIVLILDRDMQKIDPMDWVRVTLDKNRDRLIWSIGSEIELHKVGLDLRETKYNPIIDAQWDVTRRARGNDDNRVSFVE